MSGPLLDPPGDGNGWHAAHIARALASLKRVAGLDLMAAEKLDPAALGHGVWNGDFALLTHRGDAEATLNYANRCALELWEMEWEQLAMPSRFTAPQEDRALRDDFMRQVVTRGFVANYRGRRVSRRGRLFEIRDAIVWCLIDEDRASFGVGAYFKEVEYL